MDRPRMMRKALACAAVLLAAGSACCQQKASITCVYPAGGRQGDIVEVTVWGQGLAGVSRAFVCLFNVEIVDYERPLSAKQLQELRDEVKELTTRRREALAAARAAVTALALKEKRRPDISTERLIEFMASGGLAGKATPDKIWTDEDEKKLELLAKKLARASIRPSSPALAETVTLRVHIPADAPPGNAELRLLTAAGVTNPLVFQVGSLPECREPAQPIQPGRFGAVQNWPLTATTPTETRIEIPAVVNGQILPGDVDRYRFAARQGQRLVCVVSARKLIPYISDAVPGWFQAVVTLYDSAGREVAYADDYRFSPDPVLFYDVPKDGEYVLEIRDSIYRGREDFVYRVAIGEFPFVESIFPLGGPVGVAMPVELRGRNLPDTRLTVTAPQEGLLPVSVPGAFNTMLFSGDTLPEWLEKEPNNSRPIPRPTPLPAIINGRIDSPGDVDIFRIEGRAGERIVVEVYARRLASPLDSIVHLTDESGKEIAKNDDFFDRSQGLLTHHADSYLMTTLPATGAYYISLTDTQKRGGPEYAYRLRISPPQPDFALRITPSSISGRGGTTVPVTVHAIRKDGFSGPIALSLKNNPTGFVLSGGRIPAGADSVIATLTLRSTPTKDPISIEMEGRATADGREIVRRAVPAEDMMQAFFYRHLVPAQDFFVYVSGRQFLSQPVQVATSLPVPIPAGGTGRIRFSVAPFFPAISQCQLDNPPDGISVESVIPGQTLVEVVVRADAAKVKVGQEGNLLLTATSIPPAPAAASVQTTTQIAQPIRPRPLGYLPAVPFIITERQ